MPAGSESRRCQYRRPIVLAVLGLLFSSPLVLDAAWANPRGDSTPSRINEIVAQQLASATSAQTINADKLAQHRGRLKRRVRVLYLATAQYHHRHWPNAKARRNHTWVRAAGKRLLRADLAELAALRRELKAMTQATEALARSAKTKRDLTRYRNLLRPTHGPTIARFGARQIGKNTIAATGIRIRGTPRQNVRAPASGTAIYIGTIGEDQSLIIDHSGFISVIVGVRDISVIVGQRLKRGQSLARLARTSLYYELRISAGATGIPIDPMPHFARATR